MKVAKEEIFGPVAAIMKYDLIKKLLFYVYIFIDLKRKMKQLKSRIQLMLV
jgi:hypothetical protein